MTASAIAGHPTPGPARNMLAVSRKGENVGIEIADDGVGGANPAGGTGLSGLADRVAALDGELRCTSPAGRARS